MTRRSALVWALGLGACAHGPAPVQAPAALRPERWPVVFGPTEMARWEAMTVPGKLRTAYRSLQHDGQRSVQADAVGSASMLRQRLLIAPEQVGRIGFEWQVAALIEGADVREREREDAPARVVLAFDGDRSQFSARNAALSELTRAITGEPMPYALLMYVWSNDLPVGTVVHNPRTDRIRKIVVESGPQRLRQWLRYERNLRADFELAFGEAPGLLKSIAIMTDSDNTHSQARAWYGPIRLDLPA